MQTTFHILFLQFNTIFLTSEQKSHFVHRKRPLLKPPAPPPNGHWPFCVGRWEWMLSLSDLTVICSTGYSQHNTDFTKTNRNKFMQSHTNFLEYLPISKRELFYKNKFVTVNLQQEFVILNS